MYAQMLFHCWSFFTSCRNFCQQCSRARVVLWLIYVINQKTLGKYLNVTKSSLFIDLIFIRNLIKKTEELNKGNKQSKQTNNKK